MKTKLFFLSALFVTGIMTVQAQDYSFLKGDKVLNVGYGIGDYSSHSYSVRFPPVSASFEYGILSMFHGKGALGVGAYLGYGGYRRDYSYSDYRTISKCNIGVRGLVHFPLYEKLDTYAGLTLGNHLDYWVDHDAGYPDYKNHDRTIAASLFIGGRYYFTKSLAAMAELGLGIMAVNIGVAWKL